MISVIIPALNEQATIGNVVRFCLAHERVTQVIVIDDQSSDNTRQEAMDAGASVFVSKIRGKGRSMREGIENASNEIIVFLDGDIDPYPIKTLDALTDPLLADSCDFVKGGFSRDAGRVTELVAKPLLSILFPELAKFSQPLGGMIAGRKCLFEQIDLFYDYGVDIGILIDMFHLRARMLEVHIGHIENKGKSWDGLVRMSREVSGAIIHRAKIYCNPFPAFQGKPGLMNKSL
jgi:glycosyltransferase involved in cell wall biosynthesis